MNEYIWSFGSGTPYAGRYVYLRIYGEGDGREFMFRKYGQGNCCMGYPLLKGRMLIRRHGWKCIGSYEVINKYYILQTPTDGFAEQNGRNAERAKTEI